MILLAAISTILDSLWQGYSWCLPRPVAAAHYCFQSGYVACDGVGTYGRASQLSIAANKPPLYVAQLMESELGKD